MKKSIALVTLFVTCNHLAGSHSFYIGANLRVNYLSGTRNDSATNSNRIRVDLASSKSVSVNKVYGGIFLGYLFRIQNFGFGPEFFYNYGTIENTISATHHDPADVKVDFDIKHRLTANKGIDLRIGYFVGSYFLNTLLGINWQTMNFQVTARRNELAFPAIIHDEYSHRTPHKTRPGFSFGLGVQKQITENYDVGLEYKQTNYPRTRYAHNFQDDTQTTLTSDIKYKIHSIGLRFIYKF
ncbi:MAG: outer membrane beta-barrel protein [Proteobacteria bacterium]|nr:outer membrane beta-barrel protein [Pseudomonadota bacterium]